MDFYLSIKRFVVFLALMIFVLRKLFKISNIPHSKIITFYKTNQQQW